MKFDDSTISKNVSIATEFFKAYQAVKAKLVNYPGGTTGFIPFTIDFLVDGISGIKIYDKLLVDSSFLPLNYDDSLEFIVTGIDHSIKDGDWETNIKVTLIPKFDETPETITAIDSSIVTYKLLPPSSIINSASPAIINAPTILGGAGNYITPAREGVIGDYIDVEKTLSSNTLKKLASYNGGQYPIQFYTDPSGNNPGKTFAQIESKEGKRNAYKSNPAFDRFIVKWTYKSSTSNLEKTAWVNKNWVPTLTEMAALLDSKGMWDSNHIASWSPGILRRDVTPAPNDIRYGQISGHAFGMAMDVNSGIYPVGPGGAANYRRNILMPTNTIEYKTANVLKVLNENFVERQGGTEKVFWLFPSDSHHLSVMVKV